MRKITVVPYDPNWKREFEKAKVFYEEQLKGLDFEVLHVGSTSVEGLWAKPILDIDIVVKDERDSLLVIQLMESVGYVHVGNMGIEGREVLKYEENNPLITWMEHHLYVCMEGNENLRNHLLLKRHLENHPEAVKAYSDLKRKLAGEHSDDIDAYIDGKTDLITGFLAAEGMKMDELERIEVINKKEDE